MRRIIYMLHVIYILAFTCLSYGHGQSTVAVANEPLVLTARCPARLPLCCGDKHRQLLLARALAHPRNTGKTSGCWIHTVGLLPYAVPVSTNHDLVKSFPLSLRAARYDNSPALRWLFATRQEKARLLVCFMRPMLNMRYSFPFYKNCSICICFITYWFLC